MRSPDPRRQSGPYSSRTKSPASAMKHLSSLRLTLWLLAALAAASALGTFDILPQGLEKAEYAARYGMAGEAAAMLGLDRFHTSWPFRLLFTVLLLNLLACGLSRSLKSFRDAFGKTRNLTLSAPMADREAALAALRENGFSVLSENPVRAVRRRWAFLGFPLVHLSPFLIAAGAFTGTQAGFVGTAVITVGTIDERAMNWKMSRDVELPFAVHVKSLKREWYPLTVRMDAVTSDGITTGELVAAEGERVKVPGTRYEMALLKFDPDARDISYGLYGPEGLLGTYTRKDMQLAPVRVSPKAYLGEVRQALAGLDFYMPGKSQAQTVTISVNSPAEIEGHRIYLTAWGADDEGKPYVGLQITKDPGQELMWAGSVMLAAGLFVLLFAQGAVVAEREGKIAGKASRSAKAFAEELRNLGGGTP